VITHLWHHITHRHTQASKENLGNLIICGWRFPGANCTVYFQPELDGAGWTPLPAAIFEEVLGQDSPYAAMALIRKTQTEGQS